MAFDNVGNNVSALPPADYLPALEKQRELEAQVQKQQVLRCFLRLKLLSSLGHHLLWCMLQERAAA
jgi:hypothetical protein